LPRRASSSNFFNTRPEGDGVLVGDKQSWLTTEGSIDAVAENLKKAMA
jgi:hypothetical protein